MFLTTGFADIHARVVVISDVASGSVPYSSEPSGVVHE
jgi:hypothetical protein